MAWQLIYTSAPSSLEAGRSGFGTVARHRAISPLLVSAIERCSQFAQSPGIDPHRTIFSHRIIAVAGGRFHVLSAIRDAGADYTGRTNHIAHHLILEPREIAKLGPDGPSPADVLQAMPWLTSWSEQPRHLDDDPEITLASFAPQTNGSAWQEITLNPNHASLLATGDAIRGAYVIAPTGCDLRGIFGESLRWNPERLWQISFTTSLQPTDELADFRWIGLEERSPLRVHTETSSRPVFDLTKPHTLPAVELPSEDFSASAPHAFQSPPPPSSSNERPAITQAARPAAAPTARRQIEPPAEAHERTPAARRPGKSRRWTILYALVAAVALTAVCGYFIGKNNARKGVEATLSGLQYFSEDACQKMARTLISTADEATAQSLANAARDLTDLFLDGRAADVQSEQTNAALKKLVATPSLQLPEDLGKLRESVFQSQEVIREYPEISGAREGKKLIELITTQQERIRQIALNPKHEALTRQFTKMTDGYQAAALVAISKERLQPAEGKLFKTTINEVLAKTSDPEARKEISGVLKTLEDRNNQIERAKLEASVTETPASERPLPVKLELPSPVPVYFVNGKNNLWNCHIDELGPKLNYFLTLGVDGNPIMLVDLIHNGTLRRDVTKDPDFKVDELKKIISLGEKPTDLTAPFAVSAKDASGKEVFQLWVVNAGSGMLYPMPTDGIRRKDNSLELSPSILGISGTPRNLLFIQLPDSCFAQKPHAELLSLLNWSVDLTHEAKQIEELRAAWKKQLAGLEGKATEQPKDNRAEFNTLAGQLEAESKFTAEEKKLLADSGSSLRERSRGYIMAVSRNSKIEGSDSLYTAGDNLKNLDANSRAEKEAEILKMVGFALQTTLGNLRVKGETLAFGPRLEILKKMLALIQPETAQAKLARLEEVETRNTTIEALKGKLSVVYPLASDRVPPGVYRVFAKDGVEYLPLIQIQIPALSK